MSRIGKGTHPKTPKKAGSGVRDLKTRPVISEQMDQVRGGKTVAVSMPIESRIGRAIDSISDDSTKDL